MRTWTRATQDRGCGYCERGHDVIINSDGDEIDVDDLAEPEVQFVLDACNAAEYEATMPNPHDQMLDEAVAFAHAALRPSEINDLGVMDDRRIDGLRYRMLAELSPEPPLTE